MDLSDLNALLQTTASTDVQGWEAIVDDPRLSDAVGAITNHQPWPAHLLHGDATQFPVAHRGVTTPAVFERVVNLATRKMPENRPALDVAQEAMVAWLIAQGHRPVYNDWIALTLPDRLSQDWAFNPRLVPRLIAAGCPLPDAGWGSTLACSVVEHACAWPDALLPTLLSKGLCLRDERSTAVHAIARAKPFKAAWLDHLLNVGALIDDRDENLRTPVHVAILAHNPVALSALLNRGANPMAARLLPPPAKAMRDLSQQHSDSFITQSTAHASEHGALPIHLAAAQGQPLLIDVLLEHGVKVDSADMNGQTALHWAVEHRHVAMVEHLLKAGASVHALNRHGQVPLDRLMVAYNAKPDPERLKWKVWKAAEPTIRVAVETMAMHRAAKPSATVWSPGTARRRL